MLTCHCMVSFCILWLNVFFPPKKIPSFTHPKQLSLGPLLLYKNITNEDPSPPSNTNKPCTILASCLSPTSIFLDFFSVTQFKYQLDYQMQTMDSQVFYITLYCLLCQGWAVTIRCPAIWNFATLTATHLLTQTKPIGIYWARLQKWSNQLLSLTFTTPQLMI